MYSRKMADIIKMCPKLANGMIGNGIIILTLACLLAPSLASAQRGELTAFGGWQFGGHLGVREGKLRLQANENFGGMLNLDVRPGIQLELSYTRQASVLELEEPPLGAKRELFDMTVEYFQIGALYQYEGRSERVMPFGVFTLGWTAFNPDKATISSEYLFSMSFGGGAKLLLGERFGLRVQGRLLFPIQWAGGGIFCGSGGCNAGVSGGTSIVQADVTGGLFVTF